MLKQYFACDDGSLPEIEAMFARRDDTVRAFGILFGLGASDATSGGARVWQKTLGVEQSFEGPLYAARVMAGEIDAFHLVLAGIGINGAALPELGVFVCTDGLILDYRMGEHWRDVEVDALVLLLGMLRDAGATIGVPWWGRQGESDFLSSLDSV